MRRLATLGLCSLFITSAAHADEGMWLFNDFPAERLSREHGFSPSAEWLEHVRLSSVRLAQGCSGSFVSKTGLVMTNHHCVQACVEQISTKEKNYVERGFLAKSSAEERQCPALEVNQLVAITDVTEAVHKATEGLSGEKYVEARTAETSKLEKACATSDERRCDVVSLYSGQRYHLYEYRRFQDVRLVFAPEIDIAFFGGDPDNFNFPRFNLDVAFLRVWQKGQPSRVDHHFAWSTAGAKRGELVFVSGHPGSTSRLKSIAELAYQRDVALPERLIQLSELRGVLTEFSRRGPEQARTAKTPLFYIENAVKALRGRHQALVDQMFMSQLETTEAALRSAVASDPALDQKYGGAWEHIARAQDRLRTIRKDLAAKEQHRGFGSQLLRIAIGLVRYGDERQKPNEARLPEYGDAKLPALKAQLFSPAPIYPELEITMMTFALTKLQEELGPDDPFVRLVLDKRSPQGRAKELIKASKLADVGLRKKLFEGGAPAVEAAKDPMLALARLIDAEARKIRKVYEDEVESVVQKNNELIAQARFDVYGTSTYPDATFTLRLSFGTVQGFPHRGERVGAFTRIKGLYARATGEAPFALPLSWRRAKDRLTMNTPMNFVSNNDIIGGNSGSPIINKDGEIVGVVFDGNIYSLGGEFGFDGSTNRAVSVHSSAIIEALDKVYGARGLVKELRR